MANNFGPPPQYKIGNVILTAGSADFEVTDGANIGMDDNAAKVAEGDEIYVPATSKWLTIGQATDDTHGTLISPCPEDCAGTFPFRIRFQSYASRMEGRLATLIGTILKNGNLTSLAEAELKAGDFLWTEGPGVIKGNPDVQPPHGISDYQVSKTYEEGDIVSYAGGSGRNIYLSLKSNNNDSPSVTQAWSVIDLSAVPDLSKTYLARDGSTNFASAAGLPDAITANLTNPVEGAFESGLQVTLRMTITNAANAVLSLNEGQSCPIYVQDAASNNFVPLRGGEMLTNGVYTLTFSASLNNPAGAWVLSQPKQPAFENKAQLDKISEINGNLAYDGAPIAENGSNENGNYIRWVDGTQICTRNVNVGSVSSNWGAMFISDIPDPQLWASPFINVPVVSTSAYSNSAGSLAGGTVQATKDRTPAVFVIRNSAATSVFSVNIVAIGKWR